jgi:hypothetical protein
MNAEEREWRFFHLKRMGCIACSIRGFLTRKVEIHHQNLDEHAGQERLGDEYTIPLCRWHHQADPGEFGTPRKAAALLGPSLKDSRSFRASFGNDEQLLAEVNRRLERIRAQRVGA